MKEKILIEYEINHIWDESKALKLALSNEYLYLQSTEKEIIIFDNFQYNSTFHSNSTILTFNAINQTLLYRPDVSLGLYQRPLIFAVNFDNSSPIILSNFTHEYIPSINSISVYQNYVYTASQEWGIPVLDYTNKSDPQYVGSVSTGSWHDRQIFFVGNYAFFSGDWSTEIYDLSIDPIRPKLLWKYIYGPLVGPSFYLSGRPAISDDYFVINHLDSYNLMYHSDDDDRKPNFFHIIPRINDTVSDQTFNISYSAEKAYTDCALIEGNILVVAGANNTIFLFEITQNHDLAFLSSISHDLAFLSSIYLGNNGTIKDFHPISGTNKFLVADGENGLLELSVFINYTPYTQKSSETNNASGYELEIVFLTSCLILLILKRRRNNLDH
jgi:hypothetical protein